MFPLLSSSSLVVIKPFEAKRRRVEWTQPTKVAGTLRRAVRSQAIARILGGRHMECAYLLLCERHMECAYYYVDGTWNVPTYYYVDGTWNVLSSLTFVGCV
jgi:hypothetical protein